VQSWPIWAARNPTANVPPLRVDGLVQVAANRSGMSRGFELSGSLVRDVWADDGLWLVISASAAEDGQVGFGDAAGGVDEVDRNDLRAGDRERLE